MKSALRLILGVFLLCFLSGLFSAHAQVLNPNDPIVVYNSATPPTQPAWGQIGKWVKTNRLNWNTSNYKCYIYKGMQFRLRFPKSYQHGVNDGKKYPVFVFFHGVGEKGTVYDNEYQLFHGGQLHDDAVTNDKFDGFLLYPQNQGGFFGATQYDFIKEIIENFIVPQNKGDINRVIIGGLSGGGTGTWDFSIRHPLLTAAATPISAASVAYGNSAGTLKWIPIWHFQGALDNAPHPNTSETLGNTLKNAGSNYRYNKYENVGHGCWGNAWAEADYFPYLSRANKANPWTLFGQTEFCPGVPINVTIGVSAGFAEYQWRRNGEAYGGNSNEINVTTTGVYDCRIRRGSEWSEWSPIPVEIKTKAPTVSPPIQVAGLQSKHIPAPDGKTGVTLQVPTGYTSYDWQKVGNATTLSTVNTLNATAAGDYQVKVTELYGCSSSFSAPFTVIDANGINKPDPAINVLVTPISKTQLRLNWSDNPSPSYDETGFEVYQARSATGPFTLVAITGANVLSYPAEGLSSNSTYYYIVRAINNTAASATTAVANGTTMADTQAPTAPTNLVITTTTQNSISLKWNAATDDVSVEKYDIYINGVKSYVTAQTEFTIYNLVRGTTYNFSVKARDFANNTSPFSNQVTGQPILSGLPYKYYTFTGTWNNLPNFTTLTPVATGVMPNVALTPRTQDDNFAFLWEGYILIPQTGTYYFRTNSDDGSRLWLGSLNGSASPYSFAGTPVVNNDGLHGSQDRDSGPLTLTAGVYPIAMAFYEQGGGEAMVVSWRTPGNANFVQIPNSAFTEGASASGTIPAAPTNLTATAISYKRINLTWQHNDPNETGFEIWRSTNPTTGFVTVGNAPANATTYADTAVQANTRYYYNIRAIGLAGESAFASAGSGVDYAYYETGQLSNLPDFNTLTPKKTGKVATFVLDPHDRGDDFAFKYSGFITVPVSGVYTFFTTSDDGSNLYIGAFDNAHKIVANDYLQGPTERSGTVNLTAGTHAIYVTFFERGGGEVLEVRYQGPAGSGIAKQIIPANVLGIPLPNALTPALPATPAAPTALLASGISGSAINIAWTDNANNEEGYELYRSSNNNSNFLLFKTLPANTASYVDSGLFANSIHYYKVRAIGVGSYSVYSNEDSAKTINNLPVITAISNKTMRYDGTLQVNVVATDADAETLTVQVNNLPAFGVYASTGNGTGTITFTNPGIGLQGAYNNIQVVVTDQNNGTSTASFNLVVNENYPPVITGTNNVTLAEQQTTQVNISATDVNAGDAITWSFTGLPAFATPVINGRNVQINVAPGYADNGTYTITATANDGNEGVDQKSFTITVTDVNPNKRVYISFTDGSLLGAAPWNNTSKVPALNDVFTNFKDDAGDNSPISLRITSSWQSVGNGTNVLGVNTGNNSGVYPDNVIRSAYWSDTRPQTIKISGLNAAYKYKFTFFGSRGAVTDNRTTLYTIGSSSVSLNASGNSQNTVSLTDLQPNADGTLDLTVRNGTGSVYAYLNAMIIELTYDDGTVPAKARNLTAVLDGTNKANLTWVDAAYNETAYQVYTATNIAGPYTLLGGAQAANTTSYSHTGLSGNKNYYYYVTSSNAYGTSPNSDTVTVRTPNTAPVLTAIADVNIKTEQTATVNIVATDEPGDVITLGVTGLPSFATFTNTGNGTATIQIAPGATTGTFDGITVTATDGSATASRQFKITVTDKDLTSIYVNFNQVSPVGAPWNSFNNTPLANRSVTNLVNDAGATTAVAVTLLQQWTGANDVGATTGNNSGVYPDDVMKTAYYESTTNVRTVRISGLNTANKYNLVFFGSRIASDNRNTVYSVGAQSVTLNAAGNTSNTVQINGLTPDANGVIDFNVVKGSGSAYAYLNALVIQSYVDNGLPLSPSNLTAVGKSKTAIELKWQDKSDNETGFQIYRSTEAAGTYTLLATVGANVSTYLNSGLATNSTYYYKVRAVKNTIYSSYSNIAAASTHLFTVSVNFNRDNPAPAPWNNTNNVPQLNDVYSNLVNDINAPSGISFEVTDNFSGENPFGMNTGNNSGVYPDNVIRSTWWLDISEVGQLRVSGLNQSLAYTFIFFASREGTGNRTTLYTVNGSSASLNAANNISQTVQIDNVRPDENGEAIVTVSVPSGSQYGYIGAMVIQGYHSPAITVDANSGGNSGGRVMNDYIVSQQLENNNALTENAGNSAAVARNIEAADKLGATEVTIYPNPFVNYINVSLNLLENQEKVSIRVLDVTGKPVIVKDITGLQKGVSVQRVALPATLPVGVYMVQVITNENNKAVPKVIKIMKARQ